ncbi:hypothetical protein A4A49_26203 [Nicotiana attenuata]|uniref:Uncharacterized protein n=1 Tax=Nicotiana attenuata TaxID=49451 RepID=A0A1J6J8K9_NICAT|nr:hypothetical protein A4A49_26203 [Nicotiana attenuata]
MEGKGETNEVYAVTLPRFPYPQSGFHVSAGLVCISLPDCIYLCNPLMQQLCKLPKCSPCVLSGWTNVGFGFLHSTKEFKVVHFFYTSLGNHPFPFYTHLQVRCEVFTFSLINGVGGISNIWKEIVEMPPCYPSGPGLLVNECYYWWARRFASGAHLSLKMTSS